VFPATVVAWSVQATVILVCYPTWVSPGSQARNLSSVTPGGIGFGWFPAPRRQQASGSCGPGFLLFLLTVRLPCGSISAGFDVGRPFIAHLQNKYTTSHELKARKNDTL